MRGRVAGRRVDSAAEQQRLDAESERHAKATVSRSLEQNSVHFNAAREKLEKWADDMVLSAEKALADTKEQIKALRRQARQAVTLEEQHEIQQQLQKLEKQQRRQRQDIFKAEDEIMEKRDPLIESLERRLAQQHRDRGTLHDPLGGRVESAYCRHASVIERESICNRSGRPLLESPYFLSLQQWCKNGAGRRRHVLQIMSAFASGPAVEALEPFFDVFLSDGELYRRHHRRVDRNGTTREAITRLYDLQHAYPSGSEVAYSMQPAVAIFHPKLYLYRPAAGYQR